MDIAYVKRLCESYFHIDKPKSVGEGLALIGKIVSYATVVIPLIAGLAIGISNLSLWYLNRNITVVNPANHEKARLIQTIANKPDSFVSPAPTTLSIHAAFSRDVPKPLMHQSATIRKHEGNTLSSPPKIDIVLDEKKVAEFIDAMLAAIDRDKLETFMSNPESQLKAQKVFGFMVGILHQSDVWPANNLKLLKVKMSGFAQALCKTLEKSNEFSSCCSCARY